MASLEGREGRLTIQQMYPLWQVLQMSGEQIKYEIERMARELGYTGLQEQALRYGRADLTIFFRMEQPLLLERDVDVKSW